MEQDKTILIVTNDTLLAHQLTEIFHANGYNTGVAVDGDLAINGLTERDIDIVLVDTYLPDIMGNKLIKKLKDILPDIEILYMTDLPRSISQALINGATSSIQKPIIFQQVLLQASKCLEYRSLKRENIRLTIQFTLIKERIDEYSERLPISFN
jgi:DNA-binding NtrC family response regulator